MSKQEKPGYVYHHPQLPVLRLVDLLTRQFPIPGPATADRERQRPRYLARRLEKIDFWYLEPGGAGDAVVHWDEGCVFGPDLEVRWRRVGPETYTVLVLSETELALGEGFQPLGGPWRALHRPVDRSGLYLWGEHQDGWEEVHRGPTPRPYWVAARIPRRLFYPVQEALPGSRARVGHYVYLTPGGVPQFIRLAEVEDVAAT